MKSVLQDWVMELGLRHQGVLLTAVRGCDTLPKEDVSKALVRCYRGTVLNAHVGDPAKAKTFIEWVTDTELRQRMKAVTGNCDHFPHHYLMHLMHAAQVVGYKHRDPHSRIMWGEFYLDAVHGLHMRPETESEMDARLSKGEDEFAAAQTRS